MTLAMSDRDRRTLLLGALVVGALVAGVRGVPAVRGWQESARAASAEMQDAVARAEGALAHLAPALDSLEARRERFIALAPGVVDGDTRAAAGAALASRLSGAAAGAGVRMGAVQVRPDTVSTGTFTRIVARADATGDLPALARLLADLERGPELLAIREISINQPEAGGPADRPEALRMELAVEALALVRAPAPAAGEENR
jgi:hypothetical protein